MTDIYDNTPGLGSSTGYSNLTAFFDSRSEAEAAVRRLAEAGIPADNVRLVAGNEEATGALDTREHSGFWASLEDFFFPHEDREVYTEGLRRGGYLVTVTRLTGAQYETASDILDDEGSIDLDERAEGWKSEGWTATSATRAASTGYTAANMQNSGQSLAAGNEETIQVVEENLRVGKRDVNNGRVKVRAYTVETPVEERVDLRQENVIIERRSVDRPLTDADTAFKDRTISAEEHHEEAVVAKEARVVEEIGIRKTAAERTETISDTVRKTEVEVEDERVAAERRAGLNDGLRRD